MYIGYMYVLSSDDTIIVDDELKRIREAVDMANFTFSSWSSPEGADNSQDKKSTNRDPKPGHPKYESGGVICQRGQFYSYYNLYISI
jgi:hypothetical protein